ncbi:MAG: 30S ribosomal protein S17 [Parcubacteria group bacterium GW2011_GWA2_42_14]|nr:MAG: 30S ribosomal protein S17 [Parcubacteria group bacterium GW2011_GWA2_42_14]
MAKTVVVRVDSLKKHEKYQKFYKVSKKYKVHDDKGEYKAGDIVMIQETRPFSKEKRWKVSELVKRAQVAEPEAENEIAG